MRVYEPITPFGIITPQDKIVQSDTGLRIVREYDDDET